MKGFETDSPEGEGESCENEMKLNLMAMPLPLPARVCIKTLLISQRRKDRKEKMSLLMLFANFASLREISPDILRQSRSRGGVWGEVVAV